MKQVFTPLIWLTLSLFLLTSCTGDMINREDDGATFEYSIGSVFQVQLPGDPEAGFVWKTVGLNTGLLESQGEPVVKTAAETGLEQGSYTFSFKTKGAGNTILRLMYYDKNAEDPKPEDTFEVNIISGTMGRIES